MIRFLTTNFFDSASITSFSAASGYPNTNVQTKFLAQRYRTAGISTEWLKFDLGSAKLVDLFTFASSNLTSGAVVKLYGHASDLGSTDASWAAATYSSGAITTFDTRIGVISPNNTLRYWFLSIADTGNTNGYIEIGRVFGGDSVSPGVNFNEDFSESEVDPSIQTTTEGRQIYSVVKNKYKTFDFYFSDLDDADVIILRNIWKSVYRTEPLVVSMDSTFEPVELTRYGRFNMESFSASYTENERANIHMSFIEER